MAEQKSSTSADVKGVPPAGEQKTAETRTWDPRLIPGGSFKAARTPIGVNAVGSTTDTPKV